MDRVVIQVGRDSCVAVCSTGTLSAYKNLYEIIHLDFLKEILLFPLTFLAKLFAKGKRASQSGRRVKLHLLKGKNVQICCTLMREYSDRRGKDRYGWEVKEQEKKRRQYIVSIVNRRHF